MQELINALDQKTTTSDTEITGYKNWRIWAAQQVHSIDPRNMSVQQLELWIKRFELK
jgi:hypothetical protein